MDTLVLSLLGFAVWTLLLLLATVGVYRWSRIIGGSLAIRDCRADQYFDDDWYRRANRAHANCIENLPVLGAIVFVIDYFQVSHPWFAVLAIALLAARVAQSLTHILFIETNRVVSVRFSFYLVQLISMLCICSVTVVTLL